VRGRRYVGSLSDEVIHDVEQAIARTHGAALAGR
jgi:hypothetical protein